MNERRVACVAGVVIRTHLRCRCRLCAKTNARPQRMKRKSYASAYIRARANDDDRNSPLESDKSDARYTLRHSNVLPRWSGICLNEFRGYNEHWQVSIRLLSLYLSLSLFFIIFVRATSQKESSVFCKYISCSTTFLIHEFENFFWSSGRLELFTCDGIVQYLALD